MLYKIEEKQLVCKNCDGEGWLTEKDLIYSAPVRVPCCCNNGARNIKYYIPATEEDLIREFKQINKESI